MRRPLSDKRKIGDLRPSQVFKQIGLSKWRVKFDVKVKAIVIISVRWSLVERHHIWKRHLPQIVEFDQHPFQNLRKITGLR